MLSQTTLAAEFLRFAEEEGTSESLRQLQEIQSSCETVVEVLRGGPVFDHAAALLAEVNHAIGQVAKAAHGIPS